MEFDFFGDIEFLEIFSLSQNGAQLWSFFLSVLVVACSVFLATKVFQAIDSRNQVTERTLKRRLDSWNPEQQDHHGTVGAARSLATEPYAALVLPPGSVMWDAESIPPVWEQSGRDRILSSLKGNGARDTNNSSSSTSTPKTTEKPSEDNMITPTPVKSSPQTPSSSSNQRSTGKKNKSNIVPYVFNGVPRKWEVAGVGSLPVMCFVNPTSGGRQGFQLLRILRRMLNPAQVVNLKEKVSLYEPIDILEWFIREVGTPQPSRLRILVAGGDGTAGWIMTMLEQLEAKGVFSGEENAPSIGILPLGTGNDLATTMGWRPTTDIRNYLTEFVNARSVFLDRWQIQCERIRRDSSSPTKRVSEDSNKQEETPKNNTIVDKTEDMCCYFSCGAEATMIYHFHNFRSEYPGMFFSRAINKVYYAVMGIYESLARNYGDFSTAIRVTVDGKEVCLDDGIEGIIVSNIRNYGAGMDLWFGHDHGAGSSSQQDGLLDVYFHRGTDHLGFLFLGFDTLFKGPQGKVIEVELLRRKNFHMQSDGEAWLQPGPAKLSIQAKNINRKQKRAVMLKRIEHGVAEQSFVDVLDWGLKTNVITSAQRIKLLGQLSQNLDSSMKKDGSLASSSSSPSVAGMVGKFLNPE